MTPGSRSVGTSEGLPDLIRRNSKGISGCHDRRLPVIRGDSHAGGPDRGDATRTDRGRGADGPNFGGPAAGIHPAAGSFLIVRRCKDGSTSNYNAKIVMPDRVIPNGTIVIKDDTIEWIEEGHFMQECGSDGCSRFLGTFLALGFLTVTRSRWSWSRDRQCLSDKVSFRELRKNWRVKGLRRSITRCLSLKKTQKSGRGEPQSVSRHRCHQPFVKRCTPHSP